MAGRSPCTFGGWVLPPPGAWSVFGWLDTPAGVIRGRAVVQPCAASAALGQLSGRRPAGIGGGGADRRLGEPRRGALHPARSKFRTWSICPRVLRLLLQGISIGKELQENLTGLGGVRFIAKRGVRFIVKTRPKGGAIYRDGGVRFIVDNTAYPLGFSTVTARFGRLICGVNCLLIACAWVRTK